MNKYVAKVEAILSESPVLTKILYFIGFITSGYITWEALSAKSNSPYVWLAYTVVMECGKAISYLHFVKTKKKNFFTMWAVLTFFSIAASMTFLVIENNVAENRSRTSSLSFTQAQDKANRIKEQISIKQQILAQTGKDKEDSKKLTEEYNKSINSVQATINAKQNELKVAAQNKWTTTQTRLKEEINQLKDKQNKDIKARDNLSINADTSKISSEIDSLNNQLNSIDFSSLPQEKATSGFFALFQFLGFGTFWIEFFFTLALTATFEILICMLYSLSKTGHFPDIKNMLEDSTKSKVEAKSNINIEAKKASPVMAKQYKFKPEMKKVNKIGFHQDVDKQKNNNSLDVDKNRTVCIKSKVEDFPLVDKQRDYTDEDVDKYRKVMHETKYKSGNAKGFKQIGASIGISPKIAEKIHGHLCTIGEIEVVGGRTRILKEEA